MCFLGSPTTSSRRAADALLDELVLLGLPACGWRGGGVGWDGELLQIRVGGVKLEVGKRTEPRRRILGRPPSRNGGGSFRLLVLLLEEGRVLEQSKGAAPNRVV